MTVTDSVFQVLKDQLLPEIGQLKVQIGDLQQSNVGIVRTQEALIARLDRMELESAKRFDLIDKRFEQIEARMKADQAEHSRRMDLLDKRMERMEARMDGVETRISWMGERQQELREAIGRLSLLGEYVRRVDDLAAELRELRRHLDELERRVEADLPKPATG